MTLIFNGEGIFMSWMDKPTIIKKIEKDCFYVFADESGDIKGMKSAIKKYVGGDTVRERDSTFVLTSVFISPVCLKSLYATFEHIKKKYLGKSIPFHANEVEKHLGIYKNLEPITYQNMIKEIDDEVRKCRYVVQATAFNKWDYITKYDVRDFNDASRIIRSIYKKHFKRVELMLEDFDKTATMVIEESSDPKMDKMVLDVFVKLKLKGALRHLKGLYFTRKSFEMYPAGTELADFVSESMFHIFTHPKCLISLRKTYKIKDSIHRDIVVFNDLLKKPAMDGKPSRTAA